MLSTVVCYRPVRVSLVVQQSLNLNRCLWCLRIGIPPSVGVLIIYGCFQLGNPKSDRFFTIALRYMSPATILIIATETKIRAIVLEVFFDQPIIHFTLVQYLRIFYLVYYSLVQLIVYLSLIILLRVIHISKLLLIFKFIIFIVSLQIFFY